MFYVQGIQGRVFRGPLERLDRVNGLSQAAVPRQIDATDDELVVVGEVVGQREEAVRAYRKMLPADLERGPLYHADQLMSRSVITIDQEAAVADAWRTLRDNRIRQAPVVDAQRKLLGLVSERNLLTAVDVEDGEVVAARQRLVRDVMTSPVVAAAGVTDIRRIATVMLDNGLDGVPVINDNGTIVGFVSRSDILRAVVKDPPLSLWR